MDNIKISTRTTSEWATLNPVLKNEELGKDSITGKLALGNGYTRWADLPNLASPPVVPSGLSTATAGLIATLRRGYRSTCLEVIGDSTGDGKLAGGSTQVDEWPQVFVKRLAQDYPAYTLVERRWNDTNQAYDLPTTWLQTGTGNGGGARHAVFNKNTPGAMQYTAAAITTDIDIRVRIEPTTWTPAADQTIAAKWEANTSQRSWLFLLKPSGGLSLNWSTAGTGGAGEKISTAVLGSTVTNGTAYWVRATLKLDNGAAGNDIKFYSSPDGATWTQLGATITTAGVTTLFGGTAPYQIGSFTAGFVSPFDGKVLWTQVHSGIQTVGSGALSIVPPLPDDWDWYSNDTTVTLGGAPVFMLLNGSQSGQNVAYFDDSTRRPIINQPHGQTAIFLSSGHNDGLQSRQLWITNYSAWVNNIKTLVPGVPIVALGQNPVGVGGAFTISQQGVELRATRGAALQRWAASQAGVYPFDVWPYMSVADTLDQLHPSTGPGSGSEKWGLSMYARIVH